MLIFYVKIKLIHSLFNYKSSGIKKDPQCESSSRKRDSNPRLTHYEWVTLPTELFRLMAFSEKRCKDTAFFEPTKEIGSFFSIIHKKTFIRQHSPPQRTMHKNIIILHIQATYSIFCHIHKQNFCYLIRKHLFLWH